jgi:hypothetical protein
MAATLFVHPVSAVVRPANGGAGGEPLPLTLNRDRLVRTLIGSLEKRVGGRRLSYVEIERVVREIGPLVEAAARQPDAEARFRQIAAREGLTPDAVRTRWVRLQEADLLLESGGDPDARSSAEAIGVAQWLAGTARGVGLSVDERESRRLTAQTDRLKAAVAWREYLLRPDANPRSAPGAPALSRAQAASELPGLRAALEALRIQRRRVDARYDPRQAVFAQTRYLLGLYPRFPRMDWLFQAYHGGENGVRRTLSRYGADPNRLPAYETVYLTTTPRSHPAAFAYLYGRGDDHRYYWWKLRAAQEAIAAYRRDPQAFRARWRSLLPGRTKAAVWYPRAHLDVFTNAGNLRTAAAGRLLSVRPLPGSFTLPSRPGYPAPLLRPESAGALVLVATAFRRTGGGGGPLVVGDLALTQEDINRRGGPARAYPLSPPVRPPLPDARTLSGGLGPPDDIDYHTTGLAFDLLRPASDRERKVLEHTLGYFADRDILWWREEVSADGSGRRYHVVPNGRFKAALAAITGPGRVPPLPGL